MFESCQQEATLAIDTTVKRDTHALSPITTCDSPSQANSTDRKGTLCEPTHCVNQHLSNELFLFVTALSASFDALSAAAQIALNRTHAHLLRTVRSPAFACRSWLMNYIDCE